ncbi:P1 family peptidase [Ideonella sp. DXS29W]|uniref:P1 family peptidase n=1 Tax=Ideonella lacteola TaxID=2984193 RepID=A0ABU9BWI6_9BURK
MSTAPAAFSDITGLKLGHHTDPRRPTGCTVLLCESGAVAGVDIRGGATGTRETALLAPGALVDRVHAVLLTGGSAFGLDAAGGVMRWLEERGHGIPVGPARVPIVPAAVLFDLWVGEPGIRPDAAAGYAACEAARPDTADEGNVGAGAGATVGKLFGITHAMKGGLGCAVLRVGEVAIAAIVAVNALGDVRDPASGAIVAGARTADGRGLRDSIAALARGEGPASGLSGLNTTIGIVATNAQLDKAQAHRLAAMAQAGLARCIHPVHTQHDGDLLFALATGGIPGHVEPHQLSVLGTFAAEAVSQAVLRGVRAAHGLPGLPAVRDLTLHP